MKQFLSFVAIPLLPWSLIPFALQLEIIAVSVKGAPEPPPVDPKAKAPAAPPPGMSFYRLLNAFIQLVRCPASCSSPFVAAVLPLEERIQVMRHFVPVPALSEIAASSRTWREAMQRASLRMLAAADAVFDPQLALDQIGIVSQFNEMMQQPLQLLASDDAVKSVTVIVGQALWDVTWEPLVKNVAADAVVVRDCSCSMLRHRLKSIEAAGAKPLKKGPGGCSFIVDPRAEGNTSSTGGGMVALFKASVHKQSSDWTGVYGDDHIPSSYEWQKSLLGSSSFLFCGFCRLPSSCPLQLLAGINTKSLMLASVFAAAVNETALRRQGRLETMQTPQEKQVHKLYFPPQPVPCFCAVVRCSFMPSTS